MVLSTGKRFLCTVSFSWLSSIWFSNVLYRGIETQWLGSFLVVRPSTGVEAFYTGLLDPGQQDRQHLHNRSGKGESSRWRRNRNTR